MLLMTEMVDDVKVIEEAKDDGKKNVFIEGIFLQSNMKNRNGRFYPGDVMEKEVARYTKTLINEGRAIGELGHPTGPTINLDRVSHKIESLVKEGDNYRGRAKITSTPMGTTVKGLLSDGVKLGVSSRGVGSLRERNGNMEVQEDFHLSTAADIVADPSAPDAFVNGIMENVEWIRDHGIWKQQQIDRAQDFIEESVVSGDLEEAKLYLFKKMLSRI